MPQSRNSSALRPDPDPATPSPSCPNRLRHGLTARAMLLPGEEEGYRELRDALFAEWAPRGETEALLVHRMTSCAWRLLRCTAIEAELLETLRDGEVEEGGLARAFLDDSAEGGPLVRLARYEAALDRAYHRALRTLRLLQWPRKEAGNGSKGGGSNGSGSNRGKGGAGPRPFWFEDAVAARALSLPDRELEGEGVPVMVEEVILDGAEEDHPAGYAASAAPRPFGHQAPAGARARPPRRRERLGESEPVAVERVILDAYPISVEHGSAQEREKHGDYGDPDRDVSPAAWRSAGEPGQSRPEADILRNEARSAPAVSRVFGIPGRANDPSGLS